MSVVKSKRVESQIEFINTARELNIYSIKKCIKFPKRYTFYISQDIANIANEIYESVIRANSIKPKNRHEAQTRRDFLLLANTGCEALISKISLAREMFDIEEKTMIKWMQLVESEIRLLKGLCKKDSEKYKDLPI